MARWWKETYDAAKHPNLMKGAWDGVYQLNFDETPKDTLIPKWVYFVHAGGFTFSFLNLRYLEVAAEYFSRPLKPPSRITEGIGAADNWEVQRWYDRLPKGLERKDRRAKIAKALKSALSEFAAK